MGEELIVMTLATRDKNIVLIINLINKSMLICDSSRLVTSLVKFKEFRFSDSLEWRAFYTFQKIQYFLENLLVINCPIAKIIKDITIKSKLSHLLTCKSLTIDSNSSSEKEKR